MPRLSFYLTLAGLFQLSTLSALAQPQWQTGLDGAFLFRQFHSADAGGVFKSNFVTATGIGGLHVSRFLPRNNGWLESGISYTSLDESIALTAYSGHTTSGSGAGLWIIPTLFRKDVALQWPIRNEQKKRLRLSLSAGIQHQILSNAAHLAAGSSSGGGAGISYSSRTEATHRYNPALFMEFAIRFTFVRHRLDALLRINGTFGLRELSRTTIRYGVTGGGSSQQATVSYKGSGTGWGVGLRYLIY